MQDKLAAEKRMRGAPEEIGGGIDELEGEEMLQPVKAKAYLFGAEDIY